MQYRTLESLCKIASGGTPSRSKKEYWDGGDVPWIKIGNIKSKVVSNADEYITEAGLNNSSAKLFKKGTILYTIFATLGEVGILDFDACTNQAIAGVSIEKPEEITADYLYYYLKSKKAEVNKIGRGVAQNNINLSILRKFLIPMRAIEEQKTIVNSLNKIESIIEKQKQQLEQLNNLIKARFVEMFGDFDLATQRNEWIKLSELGEIVSGSTPKTGTAEYWDGDICWITPAELNSMSGIVYDSKKKITEAGRNSCSLRLMPIDTVILSSRAPIGKVAILGKEMCCNQGFKNIICNEKILPKYLYYLLAYNTDYFNSLGRGATFKEISKKIVEDIRISLPSIEQQAKFITFSEQVDKSKFTLSNELAMGNFYIRLIHDCIMHGCIDLRVPQ